MTTIYSQLYFYRHLYDTHTLVKRTPRVGPCFSLLSLFHSLYLLIAGPKGLSYKRVDYFAQAWYSGFQVTGIIKGFFLV